MKKIYIPALLLAATIVSCSQNELTKGKQASSGENLIELNVATAKTKGVDVTTSAIEKSATGVKLHIVDSGVGDSLTNGAYDFTATDSDWSQTAVTPITWADINFPVDFYSMHDGESKTLTVANGKASLDYVIEDAVEDHKDLVYHASTLNVIPAGNTINAFHKHALSKVNLYAATGTNKIYIARVNLVSVDGDGTVTIESVDPSELATNTGIEWTNDESSDASYEYYYIGGGTPVALQTTKVEGVDVNPVINSDDDAAMIILPQTTTAAKQEDIAAGNLEGTYVEVIYYLTDSQDAPIVGYSSVGERQDADLYIDDDQDKTLYVMAAFPLCNTFEPNKQYNLTLGVGKKGSTGGLLVQDNYVDKDGKPITLTKKDGGGEEKPDVPGVEPGDEILGDSDGDLDIDVSVGEWGSTTSVDLN